MVVPNGEGYIAVLQVGAYSHHWGGTSWITVGDTVDDWTVLMTLDLHDPRLRTLSTKHTHLPLPTVLNSDAIESPQAYVFDSQRREVRQTMRRDNATPVHPQVAFTLPLEHRQFDLRPMRAVEIPAEDDADAHCDVMDTFVGGSSFIRVAGEPFWLQFPEQHVCSCGRPMSYVAAVGYEADSAGWLSERPFFWGEGALYFFYCDDCSRVLVSCQGT